MRAVSQVLVVLILASILGVRFVWRPLGLLGAVVAVMLGSSFFASLSMTIAGLVRTRERLMGIGQAITMPLFFASNAIYPTEIMPAWVRAVTHVNPLSYEVNALRRLLLGLPGSLARTSRPCWSPPRSGSPPPPCCSGGSPVERAERGRPGGRPRPDRPG